MLLKWTPFLGMELLPARKFTPHADPHCEEHIGNIEAMADEAMGRLSFTHFGGRYLECFREDKEAIFNDEDRLKEFL